MPKLREFGPEELARLPKRELSRRERRTLEQYRCYIRGMLAKRGNRTTALELDQAEVRRVAAIKRWLAKAAAEEGIDIAIHKRGNHLVFEPSDPDPPG
ncbi:MAG TPA: hypothetical protein VJP78_04440 [Thermoleophilia bacterium]|nr:hypothetical protein [Thermoleophilia bacterium]